MIIRSQFENDINKMTFYNKILFNSHEIFQHRQIILTYCNIDQIFAEKFENIVTHNKIIAQTAENSRIFIIITQIQAESV